MKKLKVCPFCGGAVKIIVMDDEFNVHDSEYEKEPYSGLQYGLSHPEEENPDCPIANCDELLGAYGYDTREEAAEAWNKRTEVADGTD